MKKGKKGGIKHKQLKKQQARFKSLFVDGLEGIDRLLVKQPDQPPSKLKESAENIKSAFPESNDLAVQPEPEKAKSKKAKKKASVSCIQQARKKKGKKIHTCNKAMYIINREAQVYKMWADKAKISRDKSEIAYYSKLEHRKNTPRPEYSLVGDKPAEFVGPMPLPQPRKADGYSFANKKRTVAGPSLPSDSGGTTTPPKRSEVTQCNQYKPPSVMGLEEIEREARNNPSFLMPQTDVKWYIKNYQPDDWPDSVKDVVHYSNGEWRVDKSKYSIKGETEVEMLRRELETLEYDHAHMQAEHWNKVVGLLEKNSALEEQLGTALQELSLARDQVKVAGFNSAHASDKSGQPTIKQLATLFTVVKSQFSYDPLNGFCHAAGLTKKQYEQLRAHFDHEFEMRSTIGRERYVYRKWSSRKLHSVTHPKLAAMRHRVNTRLQALATKDQLLWREHAIGKKRRQSLDKEINTLRSWASRTGTPKWMKYLDNRVWFKEAVAKNFKYTTPEHLIKHKHEGYVDWWTAALLERDRQLEYEADVRLMNTHTYKVLKKVKDVFTADINPVTYFRNKKEVKLAVEKASAIKRLAEQEAETVKEQKAQAMSVKNHIRMVNGLPPIAEE